MAVMASVDIGSNAARLLIGEVEAGQVRRMRFERIVTRLAEGSYKNGTINDAARKRALDALQFFSTVIDGYKVAGCRAVATEALRAARDSDAFLAEVRQKTGMEVDVISAMEEARLTASGVFSSLPESGRSLVLDIGGGSAEWILCESGKIIATGSAPAGVISLKERHIRHDPPLTEEMESMSEEISGIIREIKRESGPFDTGTLQYIGTAGTASSLAIIDLGLVGYDHEMVHKHSIGLQRLMEIESWLAGLPLYDRSARSGLDPDRADLIIPGIHFTIMVMKAIGSDSMIVSDCGLPEGILIELSRRSSDY